MSLGLNGSSAGAGGGCVVGTFTGDGSSNVTLTFDAPVKALIVTAPFKSGYSGSHLFNAICINGKFRALSTGVNASTAPTPVYGTYTRSGNSVTLSHAIFKDNGVTYDYIAFF